MKKSKLWMFAAILTCVAGVILTACKVGKQSESKATVSRQRLPQLQHFRTGLQAAHGAERSGMDARNAG